MDEAAVKIVDVAYLQADCKALVGPFHQGAINDGDRLFGWKIRHVIEELLHPGIAHRSVCAKIQRKFQGANRYQYFCTADHSEGIVTVRGRDFMA